MGDSLLAIGHPTEGGTHFITYSPHRFGINSTSENAQGAWEFIRRYLLQTADIYHGFPVRIDMYETLIEDIKTPRFEINDDGSSSEIPLQRYEFAYLYEGEREEAYIDLYPLTDKAADTLRYLIESAKASVGIGFNHSIIGLMSADLSAYLSGSKTAEETAHILQNRIQTFLSEMELLR